jgi:hypothetical protein
VVGPEDQLEAIDSVQQPPAADPGVVDQQVNSLEARSNGVSAAAHARQIGEIELNHVHRGTRPPLSYGASSRSPTVEVAHCEQNVGAF